MTRYISKGEWFDEGTIAILLGAEVDYEDGDKSGLFKGLRNDCIDEEICFFSEFEIIEELETK